MMEVPIIIKTSQLICNARKVNQWTGFYMTWTSIMKELKLSLAVLRDRLQIRKIEKKKIFVIVIYQE